MISFIEDSLSCQKVNPNFIHNRFDLQENCVWKLIKYKKGLRRDYYIQVKYSFEEQTAYLGIYLTQLSNYVLKQIVRFIFRKNPEIMYVKSTNSFARGGEWYATNYFTIKMPGDSNSMDDLISSKSRYNLRREKRILEENFGNVDIYEKSVDESTKEVETYIAWKNNQYDQDWHMSGEDYATSHCVTHVYSLNSNGKILSLILSCEQTPIVFCENMAYDEIYGKYSVGQILYHEYLKRLNEKCVEEVYLMGGDYSYKKRYGSVENIVYNSLFYRKISDRIQHYNMPKTLQRKYRHYKVRCVHWIKYIAQKVSKVFLAPLIFLRKKTKKK